MFEAGIAALPDISGGSSLTQQMRASPQFSIDKMTLAARTNSEHPRYRGAISPVSDGMHSLGGKRK